MKLRKPVITRNAMELAAVLGLSAADGLDMEFLCLANDKIIKAIPESGLSLVQIAMAAKTTRSQLEAILKRNTPHVSIDLMLRILTVLGYEVRFSFKRIRRSTPHVNGGNP